MTSLKEMRPSHRIDVLTGALVYYGIRTKAKLGILAHLFYLVLTMLCMYIASLLCVRLERALKAKLIAEESLHQLLPGFVIGIDIYLLSIVLPLSLSSPCHLSYL